MTRRRGILVPTVGGMVGVGFAGREVFTLHLPGEGEETIIRSLTDWAGVAPSVDDASPLARKLVVYYDGSRVDFTGVPLDLSWASPFARTVYEAVIKVPWGTTVTYGALAAILGRPAASRAVGGALGTNRIPLIIPCHRVVAANGKLTGFSAPGGVATKRYMLRLEGALHPA
ncbi:MAG: MGMT family protein [Nitrospinae bacterium]|nr:MGMT family protein [Nitrospinota bacterium]